MTQRASKLDDPAVKNAIRVLQTKGVTLEDIQKAYQYYDGLREKAKK